MKNTEKRGLFGKSLHLHVNRFQNPRPFTCFKRDRAKGVPKRSLYCKFIKKTKKPADILMTIALQRRRSRNPEEQFTPPATSLARLRQKRKEPWHGSSALSHLYFGLLSKPPHNSDLDGMYDRLFHF